MLWTDLTLVFLTIVTPSFERRSSACFAMEGRRRGKICGAAVKTVIETLGGDFELNQPGRPLRCSPS